jgi:hypothetical protein
VNGTVRGRAGPQPRAWTMMIQDMSRPSRTAPAASTPSVHSPTSSQISMTSSRGGRNPIHPGPSPTAVWFWAGSSWQARLSSTITATERSELASPSWSRSLEPNGGSSASRPGWDSRWAIQCLQPSSIHPWSVQPWRHRASPVRLRSRHLPGGASRNGFGPRLPSFLVMPSSHAIRRSVLASGDAGLA